MALDRRQILTRMAGAGLYAAMAAGVGLGAAREAQAAMRSLKEAAAAKGMRFGASDFDISKQPADYQELFVEQCALYAPVLAWTILSPRPGVNDFAARQASVGFAVDNGMKLTGAHLLWHRNIPGWFNDIDSPADAKRAADQHIRDTVSHYEGEVYAWNVVNEVIDSNSGRPDGLRRSVLIDKLGPGFIADAFKTARPVDPRALLVLNDADFELTNPIHEARRGVLLRLLDSLQKADAPIQAVGIEAHLFKFAGNFDEKAYRQFLHEIASRGLKIIISELDVSDIGFPTDIAERDRAVADVYKQYLSVCLDERAVIALVIWGLTDRYTWLTPKSLSKFGRSDGTPERPLLFDTDLRPKPAFHAVLGALEHAPPRNQ
jgi:endo-1,4-beta-xylanase